MAGILTGCSGQVVVPEADSTSQFAEVAQDYLDSADSVDYSQSQRDLISTAVETDRVSFEDYKVCLEEFFECLDNANIGHVDFGTTDTYGLRLIEYGVEANDATAVMAQACYRDNAEAAESLYQLQPQAQDARDEQFLNGLDSLRSCMARNGEPISDDLTLDEVKQAMLDSLAAHPPLDAMPSFPQVCLQEADIHAF